MASTARAYSQAPAPSRERRVSIHVVPGRRATTELSPQIVFIAKAFMIALAVFALVACVRIGLASATVTTTIQTEEINAQVNDIRSGSASLEVTESTLANPATMKLMATGQLGMSAPAEIATVTLGPDVVAYDEKGNLSLARSLGARTQA